MELEKAKIIIKDRLSINDLPPELDAQEVSVIYKRLRVSRSLVDRDALIACHMRMAWKIGYVMRRRLTVSKGAAVDDLFQAGYYGLVQGCQWIIEDKSFYDDEVITPYLAVTARRFVNDYLEHDHCVPVERRALKKYYEQIGAPSTRELSDIGLYTPQIEAGLVIQESIAMFPESEQRIIHLMLAGVTQKEMTVRYNMSKFVISRAIKAIRDRVIKLRILGAWVNVLLKETES